MSSDLYTNLHPETTLKGTGFKNRDAAIKTLKLLRGKSKYYQFLVINVLYYRAKYHPHQTKEMREAMRIYKKWLNNYSKR